MPNKLLLDINDGSYGWTESYFDNNAGVALATTLANGKTLAGLRANMLAGSNPTGTCVGPKIVGIRASDTVVARNTLAGMYQAGQQATSIKGSGTGTSNPDNPYSSVGLVLKNDRLHTSSRAISGVDDAAISDQQLDRNNGFFAAANAFLAYLIDATSPWGSLVPEMGGESKITAVVNEADGRIKLTVNPAIAPPAGKCSYVLVISQYKGQPGSPNINGQYRFDPNDAGTEWTSFRRFAPVQPLCMGLARLYVPTFSKFLDGYWSKPVKKNRGRPSGGPRGRSRKKR